VRAENSHGVWTNYKYDSSGFLTDVAHSDGTARYYFYEDGLLTFIRDEQRRLLIHNFYDNQSHWLIQQQFGNGEIIQYRYVLSPNGKYTKRTMLTLPDGTVKPVETGDSVSDIYKRLR
jgi:YD repeat-containing protein